MSLFSVRELHIPKHTPFSFELNAGDCLGVHGPSGSGKTLLLRALADLDPPTGDIRLYNTSFQDFPGPDWRRQVAYLPAEPQWWETTAAECQPEISPEQLKQLNLDTAILAQPIAQLSTGERQRLALLRVLAQAPKVLLLDEPTASLDAENTSRVEDLIKTQLKDRGCAALWISHSQEQLQQVSIRQLDFKFNP